LSRYVAVQRVHDCNAKGRVSKGLVSAVKEGGGVQELELLPEAQQATKRRKRENTTGRRIVMRDADPNHGD